MPRRPLEPDSEGAAIVRDEQVLLARVQAVLGHKGGVRRRGVTTDYDAELVELRDAIAEAKPEDVAPLVEQMARLAALAGRRRDGLHLPVDPASPYFAHLRLREPGPGGEERVRDVLLGRSGLIDRAAGVQIVDWRDAPVSQLYYRYDEADDYEEVMGDRRRTGIVEARRSVTIQDGALQRIGCPQGVFVAEPDGTWAAAAVGAEPLLSGGQGKAARPPRDAGPPASRVRSRSRGRRRARGRGQPGGPAPTGSPTTDRSSPTTDRGSPTTDRGSPTTDRGSPTTDRGSPTTDRGAPRPGFQPVPRADKHLPEIAALIDPEQFDLVTAPSTGLLLIRGGAGSGKTTVALHRVAYLVYHDPRRFRPARCLVVVPTSALERYVAGVLPALGVRGVPVLSFERWARRTRRRVALGLPDHYTDDSPPAVTRLKKHPAMLQVLEEHVAGRVARVGAAVGEAAATAAARAQVARAWEALHTRPLVPRLHHLAIWLAGSSLEPAERQRVDLAIRRARPQARDAASAWAEALTDTQALRRALPATGADAVTDDEVAGLVSWVSAQLAEPPEEELAGVDAEARIPLDGGRLDESERGRAAGSLDPEDDALVLRLVQLLHGGLVRDGTKRRTEYHHLAVDEAQDLSVIAVKVLLDTVVPQELPDGEVRRSVTLAGDEAQRVVFDNAFHGWEELCQAVGLEGAKQRALSLSYRSTAEVMRFARHVLGPLAGDETPTARHGAPVELHRFSFLGEAVMFLAEALRSLVSREPGASVALLARHAARADAYDAALRRAEVPGLRRVSREDFSFAPGIDVTDVAQVKGLEFDYVVLLDVTASSYPETTEARHLLHIGATRAVHQLWLVAAEEPSPLIPGDLIAAPGHRSP